MVRSIHSDNIVTGDERGEEELPMIPLSGMGTNHPTDDQCMVRNFIPKATHVTIENPLSEKDM